TVYRTARDTPLTSFPTRRSSDLTSASRRAPRAACRVSTPKARPTVRGRAADRSVSAVRAAVAPASAEAGPRIVAAPRRAPVMRSASRAVGVSAAAHAEASPSTGRRAVARPPTRTRADPRSQGPDHSVGALVHSAFNSTADLVQFGDRY